jgi:hypothetical protein
VAITAVTEAPPGLSLVFGVGDLLCALGPRDVVETIRPLPVQPLAVTTVQRIVDRHGGRVWAQSEPGRGATFSFTLPDS